MNDMRNLILGAAVAAVLGGCAVAPADIEELQAARSAVSKVEESPRAGVAAQNVSQARQALERANRLAEEGADLEEIKHQATLARRNAEIAQEQILTAQAREEIDEAKARRQEVLLEVRERQARARELEAEAAQQQAQTAQQRADKFEEQAQSLEQELKDLKAKPTDRGLVVTLGDVLFDTDKAQLKPGAYQTLDRVAQVLKDSADRTVTIEGHTDATGPNEYNQELSRRRAEAVRAALIQQGVSPEQIVARGMGEIFPVATNDTAAGRQQNRRVELVFAEEGQRAAGDEPSG